MLTVELRNRIILVANSEELDEFLLVAHDAGVRGCNPPRIVGSVNGQQVSVQIDESAALELIAATGMTDRQRILIQNIALRFCVCA